MTDARVETTVLAENEPDGQGERPTPRHHTRGELEEIARRIREAIDAEG